MNKILEILKDIRPECEFEKSKDFISDYMLDSFDIVQLVTELEEAYEIMVEPSDILPENFTDIDAIYRLITRSKDV